MVECDGSATTGENLGHGKPDARCRAGHEHGLSGEIRTDHVRELSKRSRMLQQDDRPAPAVKAAAFCDIGRPRRSRRSSLPGLTLGALRGSPSLTDERRKTWTPSRPKPPGYYRACRHACTITPSWSATTRSTAVSSRISWGSRWSRPG